MWQILKVSGDSLFPDYQEGDYVLVSKFFRKARVCDVIAFRHDCYGTMIKKLSKISPDGKQYFVVGENARSVDSRQFGWISEPNVIGRVVWHIRRQR
jgi:phage repressor protein C with HTH and peptisase S24 domain